MKQACTSLLETVMMAFIAERLYVLLVYRVATNEDVNEPYKNLLTGYQQIFYRNGLRKAKVILYQSKNQYGRLQEAFECHPHSLNVLENDRQRARKELASPGLGIL